MDRPTPPYIDPDHRKAGSTSFYRLSWPQQLPLAAVRSTCVIDTAVLDIVWKVLIRYIIKISNFPFMYRNIATFHVSSRTRFASPPLVSPYFFMPILENKTHISTISNSYRLDFPFIDIMPHSDIVRCPSLLSARRKDDWLADCLPEKNSRGRKKRNETKEQQQAMYSYIYMYEYHSLSFALPEKNAAI